MGESRQLLSLSLLSVLFPIWYAFHMTTALKEEIQKLARESFREVLQEELMKQRSSSLPAIAVDDTTPAEKRAIEKGRKEFARGAHHSLSELLHEMDSKHRRLSGKISRKNSH